MNRAIALACLLVAGCANDRYVATSGAPVAMAGTLHRCKGEAEDIYLKSHSQAAVLAGAALGGLVGGALAGAVSVGDTREARERINPNIEDCMARAGYIGTSEN